MNSAIRLGAFLAVGLLVSAVAQAQQDCPADYPRTTPDSDFTDVGSGMVRHVPSGLVWKRCAEGQIWNGESCEGSADVYTWQQALARAAAVDAGLQGWNGGQTDWRVPNHRELRSIVERGCVRPVINLTQFPHTPPLVFWSASPNAGATTAWGLDFAGGYDNWSQRGFTGPVRLVRGTGGFDAGLTYPLTIARTGPGSGTVSSTPAGIACGATCTASFAGGVSVTLSAVAASGSKFAGWSGAGCAGRGRCVVTMSAAQNVTAEFTLNGHDARKSLVPLLLLLLD